MPNTVNGTGTDDYSCAETVPPLFANGIRAGYVYFISDGTAVKIGFSGAPEERLKDLQVASSRKLEILHTVQGTMDDERAIQKKFSYAHLHGDWFVLDPEILAFIDPDKSPLTEEGSALREWENKLHAWASEHPDDPNVREYYPTVRRHLMMLEATPTDPDLLDWTTRYIRRMRGETEGVSFWPQHKNGFINANA